MGWPSDSESRGTGFDSRLAQVIFGSLFVHYGDLFCNCWEVLGCVRGHFGEVFGRVWEGLGKIPRGRKKGGSGNQKCVGVCFQRGAFKTFLFGLFPDNT